MVEPFSTIAKSLLNFQSIILFLVYVNAHVHVKLMECDIEYKNNRWWMALDRKDEARKIQE